MPATPAPPGAQSGIAPAPILQKGAAPKKETARITLPPEGTAKPALPKATVKMGQTQPLVNRPASAVQQAAIVPAGAPAPSADGGSTIMSIAALVVSLLAFLLLLMTSGAAIY